MQSTKASTTAHRTPQNFDIISAQLLVLYRNLLTNKPIKQPTKQESAFVMSKYPSVPGIPIQGIH